jgi:ABC-type lipoprotein release transport system permease subunit
MLVSAQTLLLRTTLPPGAVARLVADRVRAIDANVRVLPVRPFTALLDAPLAAPRFSATLSTIFAGAAFLLATIGLYAVVAGYVRQRYGELGTRVALGATAADIRRLVVWDGLRLAGIGAVLGLAVTAGTTRFLAGLLYEVEPLDAIVVAGTAVLLLVSAALASLIPAQRATRVDPTTLLRTER